MRWGHIVVLNILYDDQDRKPSSTPYPTKTDPLIDDLLFLGRESAHHQNRKLFKVQEQAMVTQLLRRHL